jgi:transposase
LLTAGWSAGRKELTAAIRERYRQSTIGDSGRILDEFVAVTGYHRKHAIRVLSVAPSELPKASRTRLYDEAVRQALIVLWEASDRVCGKRLHLIVNNYATHSHPDVQKWLARHPRFVMHFTPNSASWLNMVERFFRDITDKRIRRDRLTRLQELELAIDPRVANHNIIQPFIWTARASDILAKVTRAKAAPPAGAK